MMKALLIVNTWLKQARGAFFSFQSLYKIDLNYKKVNR